jgi:hypothetical protein
MLKTKRNQGAKGDEMATVPYIKLDWDWREDPKVMAFEYDNGKAALVDLIELFCLMNEFGGTLDMTDTATRLKTERKLRKYGQALEGFFNKVADAHLIDKDAWYAFQRAGSARSIKDAETRQKRREYAASARDAKAAKNNS